MKKYIKPAIEKLPLNTNAILTVSDMKGEWDGMLPLKSKDSFDFEDDDEE